MGVEHEEALERFDKELQRQLQADGRCGRARRGDGSGMLCRQRAGMGTEHLGTGACKYHGGLSAKKVDGRLKSGRWSMVSTRRLGEVIEELKDDPNPLDMVPDLTLARALLKDWIERYEEQLEALLAWNEAKEDTERPARLPDLHEARPLLEGLSRMAYRIERAQSDKYIPRGQFYRVMMAMGRVIDSRVMDDDLRELIKEDWLRIEIP